MSRANAIVPWAFLFASIQACDRQPPPSQEPTQEAPEVVAPAPPVVQEVSEPAPSPSVIDGVPTASGGHLFELHRDLTGDDVPDTLRIESDGEPHLSSVITLTVRARSVTYTYQPNLF